MDKAHESNFAANLTSRLSASSRLVDAATNESIGGTNLARSIAGFAAGFLSAGLQPGDRILLSCALNLPSVLAYLGAMYAGLVPVPVDERLYNVLGPALFAKSLARVAWTYRSPTAADASQNLSLPLLAGAFAPCSLDSSPPAPRAESDLAALMPTSGSTDTSRLVMVTHGNLLANTSAIIRSQHLGKDETAMLILPLSYCFGASVLHTHLYQGGSVVLDSRFMFPDKVLRAIAAYACTTFAGVPFVYNTLLRRSNLKSLPLPSLRRFLLAGGALEPETSLAFREIVPTADFFIMYGQTEATARISTLPPARLIDKPGSAGLPLDNVALRIADKLGRELPAGSTGEVQVKGPSISPGYFQDPEATDQKFTGDGWLKTGDFASRDKEGCLWIEGRAGDFLKIRGHRVSLAEIESRVQAVAGIAQCAAVGIEHPDHGDQMALLVVPEGSSDSLIDGIRRALPPQWTFASLKFVTDLPRTPNGKIARAELPALL